MDTFTKEELFTIRRLIINEQKELSNKWIYLDEHPIINSQNEHLFEILDKCNKLLTILLKPKKHKK